MIYEAAKTLSVTVSIDAIRHLTKWIILAILTLLMHYLNYNINLVRETCKLLKNN